MNIPAKLSAIAETTQTDKLALHNVGEAMAESLRQSVGELRRSGAIMSVGEESEWPTVDTDGPRFVSKTPARYARLRR